MDKQERQSPAVYICLPTMMQGFTPSLKLSATAATEEALLQLRFVCKSQVKQQTAATWIIFSRRGLIRQYLTSQQLWLPPIQEQQSSARYLLVDGTVVSIRRGP